MSRADEEDRFLYGGSEPSRGGKALSPFDRLGGYEGSNSRKEYPPGEGPSRSPRSRSRSRERRRSRSRSPRGARRGREEDKDWKKSTDAFLSNLGATSPKGSHAPVTYPGIQHGYGAAYASAGAPPMSGPPSRYGASGYEQDSRDSRRRSPDDRKSSYGNGDGVRSRGREDQRSQDRNASEHSDGLKDDKAMITREQREKLLGQKDHYTGAKGKMENNLLRLKEQREVLKEGGAKHEDTVMRENARLQKEIKAGIQKLVDMLAQINAHLALPDAPEAREASSPVSRKRYDQAKSPTPEQREPEKKKSSVKRRDRSESPENGDAVVKEAAEKEKTKKKKKKKNKDRGTSSDEDSEVEKEKKKKKKKKKKKHQSSSSDSDSDSEKESKSKKTKKLDGDELTKQVEETTKKSKKSDETLMELLAKMSEAFMKSKQECTELKHRIQALESENIVLKKQNKEYRKLDEEKERKSKKEEKRSSILEEAQMLLMGSGGKKQQKGEKERSPAPVAEEKRQVKRLASPSAQEEKQREREQRERERQREEERERVHREREQREKEEREAKDREKQKELQEKEKEREKDRDDDRRHEDRDRRRDHDRRSPSPRSRRYEGRYDRDRGDRYDDRRHYDDRRESRDRFRERSREKSYSRYDDSYDRKRDYRSNDRERDPKSRDRNDRINLDDWQKPEDKPAEKIDPALAAIRAKILEKESKFREEHHREQAKKGWAMVQTPIPLPESPKNERAKTPEESKLPEVREQVNMQWGTGGQKKASTPGPDGKKSQPVIGKMPGRGLAKKSTPTPQSDEPSSKRSKYTGYAPGTLPAGPVGSQYYGRLDQAGMTPEMYVQAITATMPEGPPEESVLPASFAPIVASAPPKHPTPSTMDIGTILAAAKHHISLKKDQFGFVTRAPEMPKAPELGIPLPPLPAATDKDAMAHVDTRPPKEPTPPPPPPPKTELDKMLEKHATDDSKANGHAEQKKPTGFGGNEEMDPDELAMLGIDPNDFAGFGK